MDLNGFVMRVILLNLATAAVLAENRWGLGGKEGI